MTEALQILILEDEPIIAMDLKDYCAELGHEVAAVCYDYQQALQQIDLRQPNFALVDIRIGDYEHGLRFGKKLNEEFGIPFIYITSFFDDKTLQQAKETYPSGYLVKPITKGGLTAAIQIGVANFKQWRNANNLEEKIKKYSHSPLTNREMEILQHLLQSSVDGSSAIDIIKTFIVFLSAFKKTKEKTKSIFLLQFLFSDIVPCHIDELTGTIVPSNGILIV